MKKNKALLPAPEGTLVERVIQQLESLFDEVLISVTQKKNFLFLPYKLVTDEKSGQGPMMGIKSALSCSLNPKSFVIACDIPDIDLVLIERMIEQAGQYEIVIACSHRGMKEPLFGIYSKSVLPKMSRLLDSGERSLLPLFEICRTKEVTIKNGTWFRNLNTLQDYEKYLNTLSD
ncbi:MAG: NTP transferase domain-containing protein [Candidatus Aminicenantes bacterium]|nr:NTP transferase domain-containing protein [Candidatus Aminicenantes bacterium]